MLAECMSFGVVPVVYGSYSAVNDIIEDGKDGIIVPKTDEGFNAAIEKSKNYSTDKIYEQWMRVMKF